MDNENQNIPSGGEENRPAENGHTGGRYNRYNRYRGRESGGNIPKGSAPEKNTAGVPGAENAATEVNTSPNGVRPDPARQNARNDRNRNYPNNRRNHPNDGRQTGDRPIGDKPNGGRPTESRQTPGQTPGTAAETAPTVGSGTATVPAREARNVWSSGKKRPQRPMIPAGSASGASVSNTRPIAPTAPSGTAGSETGRADATKPNDRQGSPFPRAERSPARLANDQQNAERTPHPERANAPRPQHERASADRQAPSAQEPHTPGQRPPRNPRRAARPADLPQMDNLLIEDIPVEDATIPSSDTDPAELERILQAEICTPQSRQIPDVIPEGKVVIVGVRFRAGGKTYFFDPGKTVCPIGHYAIVETARGLEFGEVCIPNRMVDEGLVVPPLRPVIRLATEEDIRHNKENHAREDVAYRIGIEKIKAHELDMKLVAVQYTFDNSKLLFYFTSAERVDFRELVKDLAGVFHIRIELRQIGIRDEARMIGGLGTCGRPLCCSTFLTDFGQVSMKMAKEQNLSLNSTKISGCCGRLLCCLRYEYDTYVEESRRTPGVGTFVNTPDGPGVVTETMPLLGEVKVSLRNTPDSAPKKYKRDDVTLQTPASRPGSQARADRTPDAAQSEDTEPDSSL